MDRSQIGLPDDVPMERAAVTSEKVALNDDLLQHLEPLAQVLEPLPATEPRKRGDIASEPRGDESQRPRLRRQDLPPGRPERRPRLEERKETDLFSCGVQLLRHLVGDHAPHARAEKIVGTLGLHLADLRQIRRCHVFDVGPRTLCSAESARLQPIEGLVGTQEPGEIVIADHVPPDARHREQGLPRSGRLDRDQ